MHGTECRDVAAELPSLRRKLATDWGWALGGRALTIAIGFASSVLLARLLSPAEFGLYALVMSIAGLASAVAQFGLPTTGTRLIAEAVATGHPGRARAVALWVLALSAGIATGIALMGASPPGKAALRALFDIPGLDAAVGLTMLVMLLVTVQHDLAELFRGLGRILAATVHGGLLAAALALGAFIVLAAGMGRASLGDVLWWTAVSLAFACLVAGGTLGLRLRALRGPGTARAAELVRASWPLFMYGVMAQVVTRVDVWAVGVTRPADLAAYGAATRLVLLVSTPLLIVNAVVPPMVAQLHARGERPRLERIVRVTATVSSLPAFGALAIFLLFGGPVMGIVYGDFYRAGATPLAVLSAGAAFAVAAGSCGVVLNMTGHQRVAMVVSLVAVAATIVGVFVGGAIAGGVGVACAAAGGTVLQNLLQVIACRRVLGVRTEISVSMTWDEARRALTAHRSAWGEGV